ncbi:MAG: hypothetical protein MK209_09435 [Planctomycetes bacterium]|nr:hypothetical protein [Planctomycetota bacterium]
MSKVALTLQAETLPDGSGWRMLCPAVGMYTQAPCEGDTFIAGDDCGTLVVLNRMRRLVLPEGVAGFVANAPPKRKYEPVGFGTKLFELHPIDETNELGASIETTTPNQAVNGLVITAPQDGRFYRRSAPGEPVFAEPGEDLQVGRTVGLLEVMKTFNPVKYQPGATLPNHARLVRFLVDDASDVEEGQALIEVESTE